MMKPTAVWRVSPPWPGAEHSTLRCMPVRLHAATPLLNNKDKHRRNVMLAADRLRHPYRARSSTPDQKTTDKRQTPTQAKQRRARGRQEQRQERRNEYGTTPCSRKPGARMSTPWKSEATTPPALYLTCATVLHATKRHTSIVNMWATSKGRQYNIDRMSPPTIHAGRLHQGREAKALATTRQRK